MKTKKTTCPDNIPIPFGLSQWNSGHEVLYKCAKCGQEFRFYSNHEKFCHECGQEQDWSNSPIKCSDEFKEAYCKLVYEQHAYHKGSRPQDEELRRLLCKFYLGEFR